ncbi:MAG: hypothetical protein H6712_24410 [Myxococcales bacterium]|nr:hypothetical protein [Myxococcales bacterium]
MTCLLSTKELELLWEEVLHGLDPYAARSHSYDDFREEMSYFGFSYDLPGDRPFSGFVHVSGPGQQVRVTVHRLGGQEVDFEAFTKLDLRDVWKALTVPSLPLA